MLNKKNSSKLAALNDKTREGTCMTEGKLYELSCRAARELLDGLERGNFEGIDDKLGAIRRYVDLAESAPAESLRGEALHHREQMELLAGIAEHLAGAVTAIREKIATEMDRVGANQSLLRHLVSVATPALRSQAAGYISPASPIG